MSRLEKIAAQIRREVAEVLLRDIRDERIGFMSLTTVQVSKDLRYATIYYSQLGSDTQKKQTARALNYAAPYIRNKIKKHFYMKSMPALRFQFDESVEQGSRIVGKLNRLFSDEPPSDPDHV
jgi:ribosome-binding factor A